MLLNRSFKRLQRRLPMTVFLAALGVVPSQAQTPFRTSVPPPNASDIELHVAVKGGKTSFYLGEVIPLELSFTSKSAKRYQLNLARYDRSGRLSYESFRVTPDTGWDDPLRSYFNSLAGFFGGGLTGFDFLCAEPKKISLELNEWVQFHSPGQYKIVVQSRRVSEITAQSPHPFGQPESATSEVLNLVILPVNQQWQQTTLQQALLVVDAPASPTPSVEEQETRRHAIKVLRYLGSAAAAKELARHLRGAENGFDFDCLFGLVGTPQREVARNELRRLLSDPDHPVTDLFLATMSTVALNPDETPEVLRVQHEENDKAIRADLVDNLSGKRGNALAISLFTALNRPNPTDLLPKEATQRLSAQLIGIFDGLPVEKQVELLAYRWDSLGGPAWLPVLRKYASAYEEFPAPNEMHAYNALQLSGISLQHWYALSPEEARPAIVHEILRPKPRFAANTLGILPDKTLPEVEQSLVEQFSDIADVENDYAFAGNLASLIQRYATASILPRMLAIADKNIGHWACLTQEPVLAYLLRADPLAAQPRIERALAARGDGFTACNHSLLSAVGTLHFDPLLEDLALRSLNDPDPQLASNAAGFLGRFGSADAEPRLLERLTQWSATWHGREVELNYLPGGANPNLEQGGLGTSLQQAIVSGRTWLADTKKLQKLQSLSIGPSMRQAIDSVLAQWAAKPWTIQYLPSSVPHFNVLQYDLDSLDALKQKLVEFPSGSLFVWSEASPASDPEDPKLFADVSRFLTAHGMSLRNAPTP
jgi:hypothetical protein